MAKKNIFEGIQPDAVPRCPYFGICGGCSAQDISYERQLVAKLSFVKKQLGELVENLDLQITGAPDPYEYRTRMDYVTVEDPIKEPNIRMGLRKKGHFNHVVDLHECHLIKLETFQKIRQIFESISEQKYDLYRRTRAGCVTWLCGRTVIATCCLW
ncbi:MAG: hypothetical protein JNK26_00995 [Candidatus Doudnabacteria bacterium]|nr:hypothetical protein [Candidatus Doudnabacteria bacterium]